MKRVLVIDALNMFLRAFIVDPSLSNHGQPIGGIKGSIKILQKLVRITKPNEIVICWDGPNGSQKRKSLDSGYKDGRKPLRLNRAVHLLLPVRRVNGQFYCCAHASPFGMVSPAKKSTPFARL